MLGVNADAWVGEDGLALGAGATLLGAAGGLEHDPTTADGAWRAGLSEGPSVGVRGHWGDTDGDGRREYGFGFDVGMFSLDLSDEDPLGTMASLIPAPVRRGWSRRRPDRGIPTPIGGRREDDTLGPHGGRFDRVDLGRDGGAHRRPRGVRGALRAPSAAVARALLPDARLVRRRRGHGAGDDAARVARPRRVRGPLAVSNLALPDRDQRLPQRARARTARACCRRTWRRR